MPFLSKHDLMLSIFEICKSRRIYIEEITGSIKVLQPRLLQNLSKLGMLNQQKQQLDV